MEELEKGQATPWEIRNELGFFNALWQTIKQVLFKPGEFFENLEVKEVYSEPFYFYFIINIIVSLVYLLFESLAGKITSSFQVILFFILVPILISIGIFIGVGLVHICVMILGGQGGYRGTFYVLAYASATDIFSIIPFIGPVITFIWGIIVGVIGFKRVHKFTTVRAVFSYIGIPIVFIFVIALLAAIAIPNLLRARTAASDAAARATVMTISTAIETYAVANRTYPSSEYVLTSGTAPYLSKSYDNKTITGYKYSLNLSLDGYKVTATPENCRTTGNKIFIKEKSSELSEENCR